MSETWWWRKETRLPRVYIVYFHSFEIIECAELICGEVYKEMIAQRHGSEEYMSGHEETLWRDECVPILIHLLIIHINVFVKMYWVVHLWFLYFTVNIKKCKQTKRMLNILLDMALNCDCYRIVTVTGYTCMNILSPLVYWMVAIAHILRWLHQLHLCWHNIYFVWSLEISYTLFYFVIICPVRGKK